MVLAEAVQPYVCFNWLLDMCYDVRKLSFPRWVFSFGIRFLPAAVPAHSITRPPLPRHILSRHARLSLVNKESTRLTYDSPPPPTTQRRTAQSVAFAAEATVLTKALHP